MSCDCPHPDPGSDPDADSEPVPDTTDRPVLESYRTHRLLSVIEFLLSVATFALSLSVALGWL